MHRGRRAGPQTPGGDHDARRALVCCPRPGGPVLGCRRERIPRLSAGLWSDRAGALRPPGQRSSAAADGRGHGLQHRASARDRTGRDAYPDHPLRRDGDVLRGRLVGHHGSHPLRPGPHRSGEDHPLRISRLARLVRSGQSGRAQVQPRGEPGRSLQRSAGAAEAARDHAGPGRRRAGRIGAGQRPLT